MNEFWDKLKDGIKRSDIPVYRQIADAVNAGVVRGDLEAYDQLPTVRTLADTLGIAKGTVKHAYDVLAHEGVTTMSRGRGTFILPHDTPQGKKDKAMIAIDGLLDYLESLEFNDREIEMFLSLKLRQRMENGNIKILVIDCCQESLSQISRHISAFSGIDIEEIKLADALKGAFDPDASLVVTTRTHYSQLMLSLPQNSKLIQIALVPSRRTLIELAQAADKDTGVVCLSHEFARIIAKNMDACGISAIPEVFYFGGGSLREFLADKRTIVAPENFSRFCGAEDAELLRRFASERKLIPFEYEIDAGSMLMLQQRIDETRKNKE